MCVLVSELVSCRLSVVSVCPACSVQVSRAVVVVVSACRDERGAGSTNRKQETEGVGQRVWW